MDSKIKTEWQQICSSQNGGTLIMVGINDKGIIGPRVSVFKNNAHQLKENEVIRIYNLKNYFKPSLEVTVDLVDKNEIDKKTNAEFFINNEAAIHLGVSPNSIHRMEFTKVEK